MLKKIILLILFIFLHLGTYKVVNADFDGALKAIRSGKYEMAREKFLPLAAKGNPKAQYYVGAMYHLGKGVFKDRDQAKDWFLKAEKGIRKLAESGDSEAQYIFGFMYYKGYGLEKDNEVAAEWILKAAKGGYRQAQFRLGWMYRGGEGVPWDEKKAIKWYEKAAMQNHALAANNIGVLYHNGETIPKDPVKALMWYNIAKSIGEDGTSINKRGRTLAIRNSKKTPFTIDMMLGDIQKANRLAKEWLKKHGMVP